MSFYDDAKKQLLEMMVGFGDLDLEQSPTFAFLSYLKEEMEKRDLHTWVKPTLGSIKLEISGLGMDYKPHEEWLRGMAREYARCIEKMIETFSVFGDEVVRNQLSNLSLKVE